MIRIDFRFVTWDEVREQGAPLLGRTCKIDEIVAWKRKSKWRKKKTERRLLKRQRQKKTKQNKTKHKTKQNKTKQNKTKTAENRNGEQQEDERINLSLWLVFSKVE